MIITEAEEPGVLSSFAFLSRFLESGVGRRGVFSPVDDTEGSKHHRDSRR